MLRYHLIRGQNDPEKLRRADGDIISGRNPVMRALNPLGFRFKKTLGQGGGGIALLVELLDQNGQTDQWVVKVPVGESKLDREAGNMRVRIIHYFLIAICQTTRCSHLLLMKCSGLVNGWGKTHCSTQVHTKLWSRCACESDRPEHR